jgi:D-3-phosphoglycerate dehydrogenase
MPAVKPRVVIAEEIAAAGQDLLAEACEVDLAVGATRRALLARLTGAAALVVRSATRVDAALIAAAPSLRVIGRAGTGTANIDLDAAPRAGVLVVNAPSANAVSAAEHTMALMLALARRIPEADRSLRAGGWERGHLMGVELSGKTLGIVGLGRVGSEVAQRAGAFGMHLVGYDPFVSPERGRAMGVEMTSRLEELMAQSDFVTLHVPLTAGTEGFIGTAALEAARPGLRLVNAARGALVDEAALEAAIRSGRVAGAALDVFSHEPPVGSPLLGLPQVIATPHLGASTAEAQQRAGVEVAAAIIAALRGDLVPTAVNVDLGTLPDEWQPFLPVAEALGATFVSLARGLPEEIEVTVAGELADRSCRPLALAALQGALRGVSESPVTYVNALSLAEARGVRLAERSSPTAGSYPSVVRLAGVVGDEVVSVAGTVLPRKGPVLVEALGRDLEIPFSPWTLLVLCDDGAGVIGRVGVFLGERGFSIAGLEMGRGRGGASGMLGLSLDRRCGEADLAGLRALPGVTGAWAVDLARG